MTSPCIVILTGGALPADPEPPGPHPNDIELALQRAGLAGELGPLDAHLARKAAAAGFGVGYHQAAMLHRVVSAYVVDDPAEAELLAQAISREVDPAYVIRAASPLKEAIGCYHQARDAADALVPEAGIAGEDPEEAP